MVGTTYFFIFFFFFFFFFVFFFDVLKNINKIKKQEGFVVGEESCF